MSLNRFDRRFDDVAQTRAPDPDYAFIIIAAWILAPVVFLAVAMIFDQGHDFWVAIFGGKEWR